MLKREGTRPMHLSWLQVLLRPPIAEGLAMDELTPKEWSGANFELLLTIWSF